MVDLHIHSTYTDGSLTPEALAERGYALGLTTMALTDHDNVDGLAAFAQACAHRGIWAIPAVEMRTEFPCELHVLGYAIDPAAPMLTQWLAKLAELLVARNAEILAKLARMGLPVSPTKPEGDGALGLIHIAQAMQDVGSVASQQEAFDLYLGRGGSAYVHVPCLPPEEVIALIHSAGGRAVLAHPGAIRVEDVAPLIRKLADAGLDGLELYYPTHRAWQMALFSDIADERGLLVTTGSDFHGAYRPRSALGSMARLAVMDGRVERTLRIFDT